MNRLLTMMLWLFRIADENQCRKIYDKIKSIPELRPNKLIVANYPGYDELYETDGFFTFGTWVNGGHWATCEARMQLGYYRAGAFEDAKESFKNDSGDGLCIQIG
ncbi:MAG: hypothetical protein AB2L24_20895 [Mangrovibacterium sp.]